MRLLLVDKSAYVRGEITPKPDDELCLCAVTRLELLASARSAADHRLLEEDLSEFRDLRMDAADVVHVDRRYDALARVLAFTAIRAG